MALRGTALISKLLLTLFIAKYLGIKAVGYYGYLAGAAAILPIALGFGLMQEFGRRLVTTGLAAVREPIIRYWKIVVAVYFLTTVAAASISLFMELQVAPEILVAAGLVLLLEHLNNDAFFIISNLRRPVFANFQVFLRAAAWIIVYMSLSLFHEELRTVEWMLIFWVAGLIISLAVFLLGCMDNAGRSATDAAEHISIRFLVHKARSIYAGESINALGVYLDRYLIGAMLGAKAAGIYILFSSIGLGIYNLVNTGVMQVLRPYLIEHHAQGDDTQYFRVHTYCMRRSLLSTLILSLGCAIGFHLILPHLNQDELIGQELVLWLLLAGVGIRVASDVQGYVFYTRHKDSEFLRTAYIAPATFLVLGLVLLPTLGLLGGAISFAGAYILTLLARTAMIQNIRGNSL